jgi:precorrin-2 dehydrogenase/sirohydrochlorin ferrochelatase
VDSFPAFYPLTGRRVVIAGEGEPAESKARLFDGSPAEVVRLVGDAALDPAAYAGAAIIFIASWDEAFAIAASAVARTAGAPVNVVDRPAMSDFHTPAIVDRGAVVAAIGTGGGAPVLASLIRAEIEARVPPTLGPLVQLLAQRRAAIRDAFPDLSRRRAFFRAVLSGLVARTVESGRIEEARDRLDAFIGSASPPHGGVGWVVEPAFEDLLSLRAARVLATADLIVTESETPLVTRHVRRDAERKRIADVSADWMLGEVHEGRSIAVLGPPPPPTYLVSLGNLAQILWPARDS